MLPLDNSYKWECACQKKDLDWRWSRNPSTRRARHRRVVRCYGLLLWKCRQEMCMAWTCGIHGQRASTLRWVVRRRRSTPDGRRKEKKREGKNQLKTVCGRFAEKGWNHKYSSLSVATAWHWPISNATVLRSAMSEHDTCYLPTLSLV